MTSSSSTKAPQNEEAEKYKEQANECVKELKYEDAIKNYNKVDLRSVVLYSVNWRLVLQWRRKSYHYFRAMEDWTSCPHLSKNVVRTMAGRIFVHSFPFDLGNPKIEREAVDKNWDCSLEDNSLKGRLTPPVMPHSPYLQLLPSATTPESYQQEAPPLSPSEPPPRPSL